MTTTTQGTPKRKAAGLATPGGLKIIKNNQTINAIEIIAASALITSPGAVFNVNPCGAKDKPVSQLDNHHQAGCGTFLHGASNTIKLAGSPPDSGIFSRPEFGSVHICTLNGFGRDGLVRKAGRTTNFVFETSRPPYALSIALSGFQSQLGARTMTTVNTTTPKMGNTTSSLDNTVQQQAAIENALSMALYFMRLPRTDSALHAATAKTNRALTLLKSACSNASEGGAV